MKKALFSALFAGALLAQSAQADVLANWTFETSIPSTAGPYAAELGINAVTSLASSNTGGTFTSPAGNGSAHSYSSNGWNVGEYFQFTTSTVGYQDITVSWDQTGSNTGPRDFTLSYSIDGSTFTDLLTYTVINNSWSASTPKTGSSYSFDLGSLTAPDNVSALYFRLVDTTTVSVTGGTVATAGSSRVDNFVISGVTAVPEPHEYAVAMVGLLGLIILARRRKLVASL